MDDFSSQPMASPNISDSMYLSDEDIDMDMTYHGQASQISEFRPSQLPTPNTADLFNEDPTRMWLPSQHSSSSIHSPSPSLMPETGYGRRSGSYMVHHRNASVPLGLGAMQRVASPLAGVPTSYALQSQLTAALEKIEELKLLLRDKSVENSALQ